MLSYPYFTSLHVDLTGAARGEWWKLIGTNTLTLPLQEQWQATYTTARFLHDPVSALGIGPTTENGDEFTTDFTSRPGEDWHSLLITDSPYDQVYWYVRAPWESGFGTTVEIDQGNGENIRATMKYRIPDYSEDFDGDSIYFTITAYIYRLDLSVYERSYDIKVPR